MSYLDLNSINNIIQNFENPSISSKNPENSSGGVQFSKAGDFETEQESKKQKSSTVAKSSTGLSQPFPDYRGLPGDEKLIASAALQYVEHITNIAPSNNIVNRAIGEIKKFLEKIKDGQHLSVNNFINTADNSVFVRKVGDDSSYLTISDKSTVRLSNHAATAATFNTTGEDANNISLVVRSKIKKDFIGQGQIQLTEADIEKVDDVIQNFDYIGVDDSGGIIYAKKYNDGTVIYVEEARRGRKELAFKTMRKMKGNIPSDLMKILVSSKDLNVQDDSAISPLSSKITPPDSKVNPASEKNPKNSSGGVQLSIPGDLETLTAEEVSDLEDNPQFAEEVVNGLKFSKVTDRPTLDRLNAEEEAGDYLTLYYKHLSDFPNQDLARLMELVFGDINKIYARDDAGNIKLEIFPPKARYYGILELRKQDGYYSVVSFFTRKSQHEKPKGKLIWVRSSQSATSQATNNQPKNEISGKMLQENQAELTAQTSDNINPLQTEVNPVSPKNPEKTSGGVKFSKTGDLQQNIEEVNQKFNDDLDRQIAGTLPQGYIHQLGTPGDILLSTGVPDLPIELSARQLKEKSETAHHPFDINDVRDLPKMLQKPIGVFSYGDKNKAQNIIVEVQKDGKNFIVGLSLNFQHDGLVVNSIRGLYPKDLHEWLTWIQDGKTLYLNKEKVQNLIAQQRRNLADVSYLDLNSINNIIQNFENPSVSSKNPENSSGGVQFSKPGDLQTEQSAVENKLPDVPYGIDLKSASQVRNYLREAFAGRKFRIDSDGRLVAIDFPGIRSGVEKRGKSRQSLFDMENIVKNSYPVGYEFVDLEHLEKSQDINGQFIYAALINVDGQPFVATIKLDDHYNEEYAKFKDIGIKEMASAVRGSNGRNNSANPPAQMPRYTIHELVDFGKQNFKENSRFTENILSDFSERLDQAYFSAVNRGDMKTAQKMVENAAKRAGLKIIPKEKLSTISFYADVLHIPLKIAMQMADWDYISKSPSSFSRTS